MGKTAKGKEKAERKVAKAKRKIARKVKQGEVAAIVAAFALAFLCVGCSTSDSAQPAKSATMNNTFDDCIIIVASKAKLPIAGTNRVVEADGGNMPTLELFTQTQSLESTGSTDTFGQTATQTPTTDVKPDLNVHYNDAAGKGADAVSAFMSSLSAEGMATLRDYVTNKKSGTVTVAKKDGTTETVTCENGTCKTSGGLTIDAENCEACTAK